MATSPITFVKQTRDELFKVKWPTRDEVIRLTGVVILISAVVGIFLGGLDLFFTALVQKLITR